MKLFYVQSPYYWCDLYKVANELNIDAYEILVEEPTWSPAIYDETSKAKKIRLWNEEKYGSSAVPKERAYKFCLGEGPIDVSWIEDCVDEANGKFTQKIKNVLEFGDDVVLALCQDKDSRKMREFFLSIQKEYGLRLHFIIWRDMNNRVENDVLLLKYFPYIKTAASVTICNSHGLCKPYTISFRRENANEGWEEDTLACNSIFLEIARQYMAAISGELKDITENELLLFNTHDGKLKKIRLSEIDFVDDYYAELGYVFIYDTITPGHDHETCQKLREYRETFREEHLSKPNQERIRRYGYHLEPRIVDERKCKHKESCRGACKACDHYSEDLFTQVGAEKVRCRVPLIHGFNTRDDIKKSVEMLRELGVTRIEEFGYKL